MMKSKNIIIFFVCFSLFFSTISAAFVFNASAHENNLLATKLPIMYGSANNDSIDFNWSQTYYSATEMNFGYFEDFTNYYDFWSQHTAKLTDADEQTGIFIKAERHWVQDRVVVIYKINDSVIEGFTIKTDSESEKRIKVFAAMERTQLLNSQIFDAETCDKAVEDNGNIEIRAKYVAIAFENPSYTINEIIINGTEYKPKEKGPNVLEGVQPIMYGSTNIDSLTFNWSQTYYSANEMQFGYFEDFTNYYELWSEYVEKLTDDNDETGLYIRPERYWSEDWVVAVYELGDQMIDGFTIKTDSADKKRIKIYASMTRDSLFDGPIFETETYDKTIVDNDDISVRAKYVAIAFQNPAYTVNEIIINATAYVKPNYGVNLIEGILPSSLYIAERGKPNTPNGTELQNYATVLTSENLAKLTDNDFNTQASWLAYNAKRQVDKATPYHVLSYDLGDMATINKLLIDSNAAGFDIYISDDQVNLFADEENRFYSSDGDRLLEDGSDLDPNADLTQGELLIELEGMCGRYLGIVITRPSPIGIESWESSTIREIQVYGEFEGNDYGESLILNQEPISIYQAKYDDLSVVENTLSAQDPTINWTNGNVEDIANLQFSGLDGYIDYNQGALVLVYYLKGNCEINYVKLESSYYHGIGGVDIYTAEKYAELFNVQNCIFTTYGTTASEGIYDETKNLGAGKISAYCDEAASGRYIAFVITRVSDSNVRGWSILRLRELTVLGKSNGKESLPNTSVLDKETGSVATFRYSNPDDCFGFSDLGIKELRINKLDKTQYMTDYFAEQLYTNGYKVKEYAFSFDFLDTNGKVIDKSVIEGQKIVLDVNLSDNKSCFLGEIFENSIYLVKDSEQQGKILRIKLDSFSGTYVILEYLPEGPRPNNISDYSVSTEGLNLPNQDQVFENTYPSDSDSSLQVDTNNGTNKKPKKQWVVVEVDDPLEWFWNIYDTFAANIWMLIVSISVLLLGIGSIIFGLVNFKKRST